MEFHRENKYSQKLIHLRGKYLISFAKLYLKDFIKTQKEIG